MNRLRSLLPDTDKGRALLGGIVLLTIAGATTWVPLALYIPGALLVVLSLVTPPGGPEGEA